MARCERSSFLVSSSSPAFSLIFSSADVRVGIARLLSGWRIRGVFSVVERVSMSIRLTATVLMIDPPSTQEVSMRMRRRISFLKTT